MKLRIAAVVPVLVLGFALSALAADITGQWTATFNTQVGEQHYTYTFKVDGEKLKMCIRDRPSSSWSMARFSRSERRNEIISLIIFGTVSASERIPPVQGAHPSERIRHFTISVFSPGSARTPACSSKICSPRTICLLYTSRCV